MAAHPEGHHFHGQLDPFCCFHMDILNLHSGIENFKNKSFVEVCEDTVIYEAGLT